MSITKYSNTILNLKPTIFISLIVLSLLYAFPYIPILYNIGFASLILLLIISSISLIFRKEYRIAKQFSFCLMIGIYLILVSEYNNSSNYIYGTFIQIAMFIFPYSLLSTSGINTEVAKSIEKTFSILLMIMLFFTFYIQLKYGILNSLDYINAPLLKTSFALSYFFIIANRKNKLIAFIILSTAFIFLGERTSAAVLLLIYVVYRLLGCRMSKNFYYFIFIFVFLISVSFPFLYIELKYSDMGAMLNEISREYTGGNFFSGREIIWEAILEGNKDSAILGQGVNNNFLINKLDTELSTHNLYMFLYLEGGAVMLFLFFLFTASIWSKFYNFIYIKRVRLSAAFFIGTLLFLDFELLLLTNNILASIVFWFVITYGLIVQKK